MSPRPRSQNTFRLWLLVAWLCCILPSLLGADTFRVLSWNIEWFPGRHPNSSEAVARQHMVETQQAFARIAPDLVLLQEIRDWQTANALVRVLPHLQLHVVSAFEGSEQNLVIASRFEVDSAWFEYWQPAYPDTPPRGFVFAALRLPDESFLLVYSVHFKSNWGEDTRNFQMREAASHQLLTHMQRMITLYSKRAPCAVLVGGDFNTSLDDPRFQPERTLRWFQAIGLQWGFHSIPFSQRITLPSQGRFPDSCFDHLFFSGLKLRSITVPSLPRISDHNPIFADFDTIPTPAPGLDFAQLPPPETAPPTTARQPSSNAVPAQNVDALRGMEGRTVKVHGTVQRVGTTSTGSLTFLTFDRSRTGFVAIIRERHQPALQKIDPQQSLARIFTGRPVEIEGRVTLFRGQPQIELQNPRQIRFLDH